MNHLKLLNITNSLEMKLKKYQKTKKTNIEKEEENKYVEDYLNDIKAMFFKFAKELNVLIKKAKK